MVRVGVALTKQFPYRNTQEEFTNVFTYEVPTADIATAQNLVAALLAHEKANHASIVKFTKSRVWTTGGTPAENVTIYISDLADFGTLGEDPGMHAQACYEVQWKTDRPSATGKPVYLRKYLRSFATYASTGLTAGVYAGSTPLPTPIKTALQAYADKLNPLVTSSGNYDLIAPSGRKVTARATMPTYMSLHELRY